MTDKKDNLFSGANDQSEKEELTELPQDITFEEALKELEEIVQELEGDMLSLDKSMEKFTYGMELIKYCQQELDRAEGKIEQVIEKNDELKEIIPFEIAEE